MTSGHEDQGTCTIGVGLCAWVTVRLVTFKMMTIFGCWGLDIDVGDIF